MASGGVTLSQEDGRERSERLSLNRGRSIVDKSEPQPLSTMSFQDQLAVLHTQLVSLREMINAYISSQTDGDYTDEDPTEVSLDE